MRLRDPPPSSRLRPTGCARAEENKTSGGGPPSDSRAGGGALVARAVIALAALFALAGEARAATRYAIVVGENDGDKQEKVLRYAESDAKRVAEVLRSVGGFHPEDVIVLTDVSAEDVRRALIETNARIRTSGEKSMLFIFYSGHGDSESLHLDGSHLPLAELRDLAVGSPAEARVLVIDSCRSGALTRVKGGTIGPSFPVEKEIPLTAAGLAILASSAAGEDAQESDQIGASFFTHFLVSAFIGAADRNGDGLVTLGEAFNYASERTLAATTTSLAGPQHPTYRLELGGRDDLVLTKLASLKKGLGLLAFSEAGQYVVQQGGESGLAVAEVTMGEGPARSIALEEGDYHVTRRGADYLLQGEFQVLPGGITSVDTRSMRRVEYARVVRKGGTDVSSAFSMYAIAGARGALFDIGTAWQTGVGARLDVQELSLELRLGAGGATRPRNEVHRIDIATHDFTLSAVGVRAFDLGPVTLAIGLEVGGLWLAQRFTDNQTPSRNTYGAMVGPIGIVEVPWSRVYLRVEGEVLTYLLPLGNDPEDASKSTPVTGRVGAGVGFYF
jgi:caspase domain-containing protein